MKRTISRLSGAQQFPHVSAMICVALWAGVTSCRGDEHPDPEFLPEGLTGSLIIVGGGSVPEQVPSLLRDAVGDSGSIVIIGDASENSDAAVKSTVEWLMENKITTAVSVPLATALADRAIGFAALIDQATAVWICGGQQSRLAEMDRAGHVESALLRLLNRGGTIAGTSAGAAIMSGVMIASGRDEPEIAVGWDLLPGAIVDQHFSERDRLGRSQIAIDRHPHLFGLGIDEGTAVVVKGRRMQVLGQGTASAMLAKCDYRDAEVSRLVAGDVADLTQLRRAALQRASKIDPGEPKHGATELRAGALVIVGGGSMPDDVVARFVELAGSETAQIIVLPTAVSREESSREGVPGFLKKSKAAGITVLSQRGASEVESAEFRAALKSATGIWFGGGRQWNFVDAYEGTEAVELFRDVLRRGGVIGGSSAGATIQGEFLVRGHPLGNTVMMAEGYEVGFAFLPGAAIDQHFTQRGRYPDLLPVIRRHPKLLGIGIDEGTAVVVQGSRAEIIGLHSAHFVSAKHLQCVGDEVPLPTSVEDASKLYVSIKTGESIDLKTLE